MRLDKYICKSTELTKDEANAVLLNQQVKVNNNVISDGAVQIYKNTPVTLNDVPLTLRPFRYLLMHKPANTICSNADGLYPSIFKHIDIDRKTELHVVGRLDVDTTGLVLLTDDGSWTYKIITPEAQCEKVYRVKLRNPVTTAAVLTLEDGLVLPGIDAPTLPAKVTLLTPTDVRLSITQGKYHQVKRMFKAVGNRVQGLHREKIGEVALDVALGQWRYLTNDEVNSFI